MLAPPVMACAGRPAAVLAVIFAVVFVRLTPRVWPFPEAAGFEDPQEDEEARDGADDDAGDGAAAEVVV